MECLDDGLDPYLGDPKFIVVSFLVDELPENVSVSEKCKTYLENNGPRNVKVIDGKPVTRLFGYLHSFNDEPAIIIPGSFDCKEWYRFGKRHRDHDKPALIYSDGSKQWWVNGKCHRDHDQPAIIWAFGTKEWWVNGKHHRDHDQPAVIYNDIRKEWWVHGKRHRDRGQPAVIYYDGTKQWWIHGIRQHDDPPSIQTEYE